MKKRLWAGSLCALCAFCAMAAALSSCRARDVTAPETLVLNGKKTSASWILKLDGEEIAPDEYRYYYMNLKYQLSDGDSDFDWTEERAQSLKALTLEYIRGARALRAFAAKHGVALDSKDEAAAAARKDEEVSGSGGRESFLESISASYLTERYYDVLQRDVLLYEKIESVLFSDGGALGISGPDMLKVIESEYVAVRYIMLEYTDETKAEKRELAAELAERLAGGGDFSALVNEYTEEPLMLANPYGVYFMRGMKEQALEDACFALKEGEISGVTEGENGFFIIKRLIPDSKYLEENLERLKTLHLEHLFTEELKGIAANLEAEENPEIYGRISPDAMG